MTNKTPSEEHPLSNSFSSPFHAVRWRTELFAATGTCIFVAAGTRIFILHMGPNPQDFRHPDVSPAEQLNTIVLPARGSPLLSKNPATSPTPTIPFTSLSIVRRTSGIDVELHRSSSSRILARDVDHRREGNPRCIVRMNSRRANGRGR